MINAADNEKAKEIKKATEAYSYPSDENETLEDAEEGPEAEEVAEDDMPFDSRQVTRSVSVASTRVQEESVISAEEQKWRILKEKYLNAVGRRPKTLPFVSLYPVEEEPKSLFIGERRPDEVQNQRKERWRNLIKKMKPIGVNYARVIKDVRLSPINHGLMCVRFEHFGNSLATAHRNGSVEVRNSLTGEVLMRLITLESKDKVPARALKYHPDNSRKLYVGGAAGSVQVYDIDSPRVIAYSDNIDQINTFDLNFDGNNLVIGGRTAKITIMDPLTLQVKATKQRPNINENTKSSIDDEYHNQRIYCMKCHPEDPNIFLTGGWDGTVKVWDFRVPGAVLSIKGPWIDGEAVDILGNTILTASWKPDNAIQLWDFSTGRHIRNIPVVPKTSKFEGEFLYCGKFFRDTFNNNSVRNGLIAVSGNGFHEVSILDLHTHKVIAYFPSHKGVFCLDLVGNLIAYGGRESIIRIGELLLPKEILEKKPHF